MRAETARRRGRRRVVLLIAALILSLSATTLIWRLVAKEPPASSPGCSSCALQHSSQSTRVSPASTSSDDLSAASQIRADNRAYQGPSRGDVISTSSLGFELPTAPAVLFDYRYNSAAVVPKTIYAMNAIRDWAAEFGELRFVVVLGNGAESSDVESFQEFFDEGTTVVADTTGEFASGIRRADSPRLFGILVDSSQRAVCRLPQLTPKSTESIRELLFTFVETKLPPVPPYPYAAVHPSQAANPWDVIENASGALQVPGLYDMRGRNQPTLLYLFDIDCPACEIASVVTSQLAKEYKDSAVVLGLAFAPSPSALASAARYGMTYLDTLGDEKKAWVQGIPSASEDLMSTVGEEESAVAEYASKLDYPFPVLIDWDRRLSGSLGMGLVSFPSWALFDAGGELIRVMSGSQLVTYEDGVPNAGTRPSLQDLRTALDTAILGTNPGPPTSANDSE